VSTNGSGPLRPPPRRLPISRRAGLALGAAGAAALAVALVAPVFVGGAKTRACAQTLRYGGRTYDARRVSPGVVEAIAVGVGVATGCGTTPSNVNLRSITGVQQGDGVAVTGEQSVVYVRRGVCVGVPPRTLLACLRSR
jgi:hypothetical protein